LSFLLNSFGTALSSFGFYDGKVQVKIAGHPLDDPALADTLDAAPAAPPVPIAVSVETGARFHLGSVELEGTVPQQRLLSNAPCELPPSTLAALFEGALRYW